MVQKEVQPSDGMQGGGGAGKPTENENENKNKWMATAFFVILAVLFIALTIYSIWK